jgi:hypothetical protein
MTGVVGITSNGYIYAAAYNEDGKHAVRWSATFRRNGIEQGMRHGKLLDVSTLSEQDLRIAVQDDIENTWLEQC